MTISAIEKLKLEVIKYEYDVKFYALDITNRELVYKYAEFVKDDIGVVDILINNAGIVCGQTFLDIPDYMIEKTYNVNILSHYWVSIYLHLTKKKFDIEFIYSLK